MNSASQTHSPDNIQENARWARGTYFRPADEAAHELANEGHDVRDECLYCGNDFMMHNNARCPK